MDSAPLMPLLKLAGVFALIVVLLRRSVHVGLALGIGAAALGFSFSMGLWELLKASWVALFDGKALLLTVVITLILILSSSLDVLGHMEQLLGRFRRRTRGTRWALVAFPALIGLLPMPGGAYFSAPMLDAFDPDRKLSPGLKSFLNHWYRHVWEYWWPLFPAVLLTCTISEFQLWEFGLVSFPMTLVAIIAGFPHLRRVSKTLSSERPPAPEGPGTAVWKSLMPLALAIVPGVGFGAFAPLLGKGAPWASLPREMGLVAGLVLAVSWSWWSGGIRWEQARRILLDFKMVRMWGTVAGVFVFKGIIEQSGAAEEAGRALLHLQIPFGWVAVLLPLIVGGISGLPIAFVGACFPILISVLQAMGAISMKLPWIILAFVSGFTGSLLAPTHLCLILSNEYFRASWTEVYSRMWLPALILLAGGIGYFWTLMGLMG